MRRYFISGLILLLPITITILVFIFLIDILTAPFNGIIDTIFDSFSSQYTEVTEHKDLVEFISRIVILGLLFLLTLVLGYFGQKFLFRSLFKMMHWTFSKLPFVRSIYKVTKEVTHQVFELENSANLFRKTVITRFPHSNAVALGFQAGYVPKEAEEKLNIPQSELETIFVPTAPHPICGFVLIQHKDQSKEIALSVEEVFKVLVSCGLYAPESDSTHK